MNDGLDVVLQLLEIITAGILLAREIVRNRRRPH